jgi:hypothetical protein
MEKPNLLNRLKSHFWPLLFLGYLKLLIVGYLLKMTSFFK